MKQYVLELAPPSFEAPRSMADETQAPPPASVGSGWRALGLVLLVEPVALGLLYLLLVGSQDTTRVSAAGSSTVVSPIRRAERAPVPAQPATVAVAVPAAPSVPQGRVTSDRGGYAIDLRSVAPDAAVALLAKATGARVSGEQIFHGSALRLTHASLAPSAREAWQAVFGGVASFAASCPRGGCEVRFVSLVPSTQAGQAALSTRLVEELVQGVSIPAPMPAPLEQGRAPPVPAPALAPAEDPNASEN